MMPRMSRTLAWCQLSAAAVLTALSCTPAHAEIYHCIVDGVPKFSDKPCHAGDAPVAVPGVTVVPAQKADSLTRQHDARVQQYPKARAEEDAAGGRSEEHTSELQSLMRTSYAVFCVKKKNPRR